MIEYNKRLVEVSVILNHLNKSDYDKIPKEVIDRIEKNKDIEYVWNYDETKDLKKQNVSQDTIAILSYINMQYLLNEDQRKFVQEIFNENQRKADNIKKEKYNPDDIFKKKNEIQEVIKQNEETRMIVVGEEKWYKKIFNIIKNLFKRK